MARSFVGLFWLRSGPFLQTLREVIPPEARQALALCSHVLHDDLGPTRPLGYFATTEPVEDSQYALQARVQRDLGSGRPVVFIRSRWGWDGKDETRRFFLDELLISCGGGRCLDFWRYGRENGWYAILCLLFITDDTHTNHCFIRGSELLRFINFIVGPIRFSVGQVVSVNVTGHEWRGVQWCVIKDRYTGILYMINAAHMSRAMVTENKHVRVTVLGNIIQFEIKDPAIAVVIERMRMAMRGALNLAPTHPRIINKCYPSPTCREL